MSYHTLCVSMCVTKFLLSWSHGFININYFVEKKPQSTLYFERVQ